MKFFKTTHLAILIMGTAFASCKKEGAEAPVADEQVAAAAVPAKQESAWLSNINLNWNGHPNGATYSQGQAATDFGNASGWNASRAYTTNGKDGTVGSRVTLLPNALSGAGGMVANVDLSDGSAYEMDYDIKFHSQFNWSRGGKVGFGFGIGEANAGGDAGWDGNGGTLRLMWYSPNSNPNRVFFQPYIYYKDQNGGPGNSNFGDTFGRSYPASGALQKNQWYHVHLYAKSNTGSNTNGHVQIVINGTVLLDQPIRWTTNDAQRLIKLMTFHTFRGGSQDYWKASSTDYIYYDNLVVNKISN